MVILLLLLLIIIIMIILGARDGAVMRALASHQCGPGSNPGIDAICGLSLLLVFSFTPRGFSPGTLVFPSPQKPTLPNYNSTRNQVDEESLCGCATSKSLFIYYFYIIHHHHYCSHHQNLSKLPSNVASPVTAPAVASIVCLFLGLPSKTVQG